MCGKNSPRIMKSLQRFHVFALSILWIVCTIQVQAAVSASSNHESDTETYVQANKNQVYVSSDYKADPRETGVSSGRSLILKSILFSLLIILALILGILPLVPLVTIPVPGRRNSMSSFYYSGGNFAKNVLASDSCIERVSCEISRAVRNYGDPQDIPKYASKLFSVNNQWMQRMSRGFSKDVMDCSIFSCNALSKIKNLFTGKVDKSSL